MITYEPLWETMKKKKLTTYTLRFKFEIGNATVQRFRKNMHVSTYTLDKMCKLLECEIHDIVRYIPDENNTI